jgi:hypothetical protein
MPKKPRCKTAPLSNDPVLMEFDSRPEAIQFGVFELSRLPFNWGEIPQADIRRFNSDMAKHRQKQISQLNARSAATEKTD